MLDIFVLEEDYFQQARLEDAIHKSKQIYILRIGKVNLYDKPNQLLERITERGSHLLFFLDIGFDSNIEGGIMEKCYTAVTEFSISSRSKKNLFVSSILTPKS